MMELENPGKSPPDIESPEALAERLSLPFSNYLLLSRALTHRSYLNEHPEAIEDNERLEFLGDAVLDFMVGDWLYNHYPEMAEGELTRMRSALVRTEQLAEFALKIRLDRAVRLGHGEEENGGRWRLALLCATFEAIIGALYLNAGMSVVQGFMEPLLKSAVSLVFSDRRELDSKSLLQEYVQSQGFGPPIYHTIRTSGPEHDKTFEVEVIVNGQVSGSGKGHSKQHAAKEAARNALDLLGIE